jgi:hypothetical protein
MELHEFLEARIAEDEDYAQNIIDCEYDTYKAEWGYLSSAKVDIGSPTDYIDAANDSTVAKFIERFDPARILAECAAKRAVIDAASDEITYIPTGRSLWNNDPSLGYIEKSEGRVILEALAAPYSSHPDYDQSWAVA